MLNDLKKEMPYKFKPQTCNEYSCIAVAYIDARQVMDLLDDVIGPGKWQTQFSEVGGNTYCSLGIKIDNEWVWKTDCGVESNIEKEKGQASDALKRAAVHWGIGRFLYELKEVKLKTKQHTNKKWYPADDNGNILWNKEDITRICRAKLNQKVPEKKLPTPKKTLSPPTEQEKTHLSKVFDLLEKDADGKEIDKGKLMVESFRLIGRYPQSQSDEERLIKEVKVENLYKEKV